jgi:hypothetical protein
MCICKETVVRDSPNDSIFAGGKRQGSRGETCYATFDENPVSSLPERGVIMSLLCDISFCNDNSIQFFIIYVPCQQL